MPYRTKSVLLWKGLVKAFQSVYTDNSFCVIICYMIFFPAVFSYQSSECPVVCLYYITVYRENRNLRIAINTRKEGGQSV